MTGALTPVYFSASRGHFRSSLRATAMDASGNPIPWYTYPTIDFLASKTFDDMTVLEFGGGQSTLWWANRAHRVVTFESDSTWHDRLRQRLPSNVDLRHCRDDLSDAQLPSEQFDIVVVDGCDRLKAASKSVDRLKPDGALILDNSDQYWGEDGTYPIMDLLRPRFSRVDFYGHAAGVIMPHCTSIFFPAGCFLFRGDENPTRRE